MFLTLGEIPTDTNLMKIIKIESKLENIFIHSTKKDWFRRCCLLLCILIFCSFLFYNK